MKSRLHVIVFGIVQGVFFRANTKEQADHLDITGWVKNRTDGGVEIIAEGEKEKLESLLEWTKYGPTGARVTRHQFTWENYKEEFDFFEIRR